MSYIIKAAPEQDLYALWSPQLGSFVWLGQRADLLAELTSHDEVVHDGGRCRAISPEAAERDVARADEHGTSVRNHHEQGGWNVERIQGSDGWMYRRDLLAFLVAIDTEESTWEEDGDLPTGAARYWHPYPDDEG